MKELEEISKLQDEEYKRLVGVSKADFQFLLMRLQQLQEDDKKRNPMKSRGIKGDLSLEQQLLLTFYYLRHYATFQILGRFFGISESYCCKVYQKISRYLLRILSVSGRKVLLDGDLKAIAIDVTEQPIERPAIGQQDYFSGKKNSTR
jgi:Helix-turn-helix of DDE superfamily endonuclease